MNNWQQNKWSENRWASDFMKRLFSNAEQAQKSIAIKKDNSNVEFPPQGFQYKNLKLKEEENLMFLFKRLLEWSSPTVNQIIENISTVPVHFYTFPANPTSNTMSDLFNWDINLEDMWKKRPYNTLAFTLVIRGKKKANILIDSVLLNDPDLHITAKDNFALTILDELKHASEYTRSNELLDHQELYKSLNSEIEKSILNVHPGAKVVIQLKDEQFNK